VIDRLADDLRREFPEMRGFSGRNLKYMKAFGEAYPDGPFVQEVLAQITWYHNITLLEKVKDPAEREWYVRKTVEQGWSRAVLVHQIETGLYARQGRAQTNFERTLPAPHSDLAQQLLKDPYCFDFLTLTDEARERELQRGLVERLRDFLIELGVGFAFVGSLYHLVVGRKDYYLDLLFYHLRLRCFVVIELKVDEFEPEHAGKMSFYLSAVDDLLRHAGDAPAIGQILNKTSNRVVIGYALRDTAKPMGVATYAVRRVEALQERPRIKSTAQQPLTCGPSLRQWAMTSSSSQPASSKASARIGKRSNARSSYMPLARRRTVPSPQFETEKGKGGEGRKGVFV
jgi:predicted nuclease of restriction endonuclease-like (RecB) superfamily